MALIIINQLNLVHLNMSTLEAIGISGFRSYSTQTLEKVDFEKPLTLIWGKNGSGKTTIIQVLKYITTGSLPPNCQKGKNFILQPRIAGISEVIGEVRLKFRAFNDRPVLAKRKALLSTSNKGIKFQSIEQTLKTKDFNGQMIEINHQCAEIQKQIPQLLGISKPVLQNIVFCHQDQSLWPFSDSANLKNIFDEMFQTKRYTKIIDAFWEQHKDYAKQTKQNKKVLEYLQRLYQNDNKKKLKAFKQMEEYSHKSYQILQLRNTLEKTAGELKISGNEGCQLNQNKFKLVKKRGAIQEQLRTNIKSIQEMNYKKNILNQQYLTIYGIDLINMNINYEQNLIKCQELVNKLTKRKQEVRQQLQQSKNINVFSQKQMEIMGEIKRAKDCLPELKKETLSDNQILKRLQQKCQFLQKKKSQLLNSKLEKQKMCIPNKLELFLNQGAFQEQKNILNSQNLKKQQLRRKIIIIYCFLYKPIEKRNISNRIDQNVEQKLREVEMKLKMMREELEKYEQMPRSESLKQKIFKLRYTGMQIYQNLYCFCLQRKKCSFCSKPVTTQQLQLMRVKCDKIKAKTQIKVKQLQSQQNDELQIAIDPDAMIKKLTNSITQAQILQKQLNQQYQQWTNINKQNDQIRINQRLTLTMKRLELQYQPTKQSIPEPLTFQSFVQVVGQYENIKNRIDSKTREIKNQEERIKKNKQIQKVRIQMQDKKIQLIKNINALEEETKDFDIFNNLTKRLTVLLKSMGNNSKKAKGSEASGNESASSIDDISKQFSNIQKQLKGLLLQKQLIEVTLNMKKNSAQKDNIEQFLKQTDQQIEQVNRCLQAQNKIMGQYNNLRVQFQTKKAEIDLKCQMTFQQYHNPVEKQFLMMKIKQTQLQAAAKDIQSVCRSIQNAISFYHQQKMDEINKILAQIWRDVYHGNDINLIQIQATIEEDGKKKKNYHYSIVMQKSDKNIKMEMKGRCSMGQKVLASIVIRLALAQVFSNNARILALDEPTTNLDRQHINNLSIELSRLLQLSDGKYLQMIIISHDLQFIKTLEKYTSHYYEVSRNSKNYSIIKKKDIRQIFSQK